MNDIILLSAVITSLVLLLAMGFFLARLSLEQRKLKQDLQAVMAQLHRQSDDVAGLCSAAVAVDRRLAANESRLNGMREDVGRTSLSPASVDYETEHDEPEQEPAQGYQLAIEKIRLGVSVEELVKTCSLTRDEAVLLMRLHGKKQG